jgi:hypothetical protein
MVLWGMGKSNKADITGDTGQNLARLLLSHVAMVNDYRKDVGLDFFCELRDDKGMTFCVQAKASLAPHRTESSISSLPVNCKTIEQYWLQGPSPVFIFMSDASRSKTYYVIVSRETYRPRARGKTYTFSVPLANEVTSENIGKFVSDVVNSQAHKSTQERESFLRHYYSENRDLYHDLDEDARFLEIMRGSDQHAQVEVKMLLKQRFESGAPISRTIRENLIDILRNCKDLTTQIHILDTLIYINERSVIPEIVKQVDRNIRTYEYLWAGGRSHDIDFLFQGLVRFKAIGVDDDLNRFLRSKDSSILRNAARTSGELRLKKTVPNLLKLLSYPDENVRLDASRALALMIDKSMESRLKSLLRKQAGQIPIDVLIRTLAETGDAKLAPIVSPFVSDPNNQVREAVTCCLGKVDPKTHVRLLVSMMNDDDFKVREQAKQSVHNCISRGIFSAIEIEKVALPMLREAYSKEGIQQTNALLHFCKGDSSIPTLLEIYFDEKQHQKEFEYHDSAGNVYMPYIDLKLNVLEILKKRSIPAVEADVLRRLEIGDSNLDVKYIIAAGEMKLQAAFVTLSKLFLVKRQPNIGWIRSALFKIDPDRAKSFSCDVLKTDCSLDVAMSCFEILHSFKSHKGITKGVEDLIRLKIARFSRRANVRADVHFQMWVRIFNVTEVVPLLMKDLRADRIEISTDILEMIKIPEGRDFVISKLPSLDPSLKNICLQWLGNISNPQSIDAISEYIDDTDPDTSRIAKSIIEKSKKTI